MVALGGYDKRATADVPASCLSWSLSFWGWVYSRKKLSDFRLQPFFVVTGDALITFRQRDEFRPADDVVDILERLVAGAAVDFVEDCIRRRLAVGQYDFAGGRKALLLIGFERGDRVSVRNQGVDQRAAIQNGLGCAIGAARIHRMGGVAEQCEAAEAPAWQRILVDHRIFQDGVGAADEFRHVEPIESP